MQALDKHLCSFSFHSFFLLCIMHPVSGSHQSCSKRGLFVLVLPGHLLYLDFWKTYSRLFFVMLLLLILLYRLFKSRMIAHDKQSKVSFLYNQCCCFLLDDLITTWESVGQLSWLVYRWKQHETCLLYTLFSMFQFAVIWLWMLFFLRFSDVFSEMKTFSGFIQDVQSFALQIQEPSPVHPRSSWIRFGFLEV